MNKYYCAVNEEGRWVIYNDQGWEYDEAKCNFELLVTKRGKDNVFLLYAPCVMIDVKAQIPVIRSSTTEMVIKNATD